MAAISQEDIVRYAAVLHKNPIQHIAKGALNKAPLQYLVSDADKAVHRVFKYTVRPHVIKLANQEHSGRCWIFSFTNMMRRKMIQKYNLPPTFKLSQKYIMFFDRLEKCNAFMEVMYFLNKKKGVKMYSFEMTYIRQSYMSDGGTWSFFKDLVLKYGVVPYDQYPDNVQAKNSAQIGKLLWEHVNSYGIRISKTKTRAEFEKIKREALVSCYSIIEMFLGKPPSSFVWEYTTKDEKYRTSRKALTPSTFYQQYIRNLVNVDDYVALINDPRRAYDKIYSVELLHNVLPPTKVPLDRLPSNIYLNVPIDTLRDATYNSIRKNMSVPFAGDVSYFMHDQVDDALIDTNDHYQALLGVQLVRPRKFLFDNMLSSPNHAMLIIGCNGARGDWEVENSWKQSNQDYQYLTMTDDWFEYYVGEVIVHKRVLSHKLRALYTRLMRAPDKITYYPYWDIFGSVANMRRAVMQAGAK